MPGEFRNLKAWQLGIALANDIYTVTDSWPSRELYGLSSQIRRAAFSVPANVAEGRGRQGRREYRHFVEIAYGSLCEVETALVLARLRSYITEDEEQSFDRQIDELARVLRGLMRYLADSSPRTSQASAPENEAASAG